jgi:hypothetical protein
LYRKNCALGESFPRTIIDLINWAIGIGSLFVLNCEKGEIYKFTSEKSMWMKGILKESLTSFGAPVTEK